MTDVVLDDSQLVAVELIASATVGVVTGGPGVGKSTCLRQALDRLDASPVAECRRCSGVGYLDEWPCAVCEGSGGIARYLLAAPTGKAARRMEEATGRAASTVHRLLEYGPLLSGGMGFRRNADRPIAASVVVIDEASMLDVELASALTAAIAPASTRLILVGDANQLPSVGPGRVFADLIDSGRVPVARLTTLHRSAAHSWVATQAPRILAGEVPDLRPRDDFRWECLEARDLAVTSAVGLAADIGAQVLVAQNIGPAGADVVNAQLQALVNPNGMPAWKLRDAMTRVGDAVIQCSNNYALGVMNGETGRIVRSDADELVVDFGEPDNPRHVTYGREQARGLRLAYALTVHKSQGSEWPWVVVLCHSTHARMLSRNLFYTAITRAKRGVVLVGDRKGLEYAVKQTRDADRNTALRHRIDAEARRAGLA